ncbi:glycoside hydrolase family 13 protein [Massilia sp. Root335]|uniref:glycoside hydrolase family 13 protein n=1 Tax=Massilia sp. Root335 TaxID=1736517 RepID=UPI001E5358D5|nr:glycoside hydrolase family 13 protein [Massilia sp. Root335]
MMRKTLALAVSGLALALDARGQDYAIRHLEPLSWWTGMKNPHVQLMVHGDRIGELTPRVAYDGVRIAHVERVANPDYLFIDLDIGAHARPGEFMLRFAKNGRDVLSHPYRLAARAPGSARRRGFGPADAIYLLVPDRFANGDPGNDSVPALTAEATDRADPDGRHGGDIRGIRDHLGYIADLGFTMLWPAPLNENDMSKYSYAGYSITDFYHVDARFGSNEDYRRLVADAKAKGLGVIHDMVFNHVGAGHWWMKDLPAADWVNPAGRFNRHAHVTVEDMHASLDDRGNFTDGWFDANKPDLNQRNPLLATYLIQNTIWWTEYLGVAGIRIDTYSYSDKAFLARWARAYRAEYPNLTMVGEDWHDSPAVVSYWQQGKRNRDGYRAPLPAVMDFPLHYAWLAGMTQAPGEHTGLARIYELLALDFLYPDPGRLVIFPGNHDTPRFYSSLGEDFDLYKMSIAWYATTRGVPQLFAGDEILATSPLERADGLVRADFPGGWAGDPVDAFSGRALSARQQEAQRLVRTLFNWRKHSAAVGQGRLVHFTPEHGTYVYFRCHGTDKVMVALNENRAETVLATARFGEMLGAHATGTDVVTGKTYDLAERITLPPRSALVLEIRQ